jgi:hypothetical protein
MIITATLSDEITSEASDLRAAYPKGATPHDLAGWFAQPIARIEAALAELREQGADLSFMRQDETKDPAAVAMGRRGGRARADKLAPERRAEIAKKAATGRWSNKHTKKLQETEAQTRARSILPRLPELAEAFPLGARADQFAKHFGLTAAHAYPTIHALVAANQANWEQLEYGGESFVFVAGMRKPLPPLTDKQQQVYEYLANRADADGELIVVYKQVGDHFGAQGSSIMSRCDILERKGYIRRLSPYPKAGNQNSSPRYAVFSPEPRPVVAGRAQLEKLIRDTASDDGFEFEDSDPPAIHKALQRRRELLAELNQLNGFLRLYGELDHESK